MMKAQHMRVSYIHVHLDNWFLKVPLTCWSVSWTQLGTTVPQTVANPGLSPGHSSAPLCHRLWQTLVCLQDTAQHHCATDCGKPWSVSRTQLSTTVPQTVANPGLSPGNSLAPLCWSVSAKQLGTTVPQTVANPGLSGNSLAPGMSPHSLAPLCHRLWQTLVCLRDTAWHHCATDYGKALGLAEWGIRKLYADTTVRKFFVDSAVRKFYADTTVRKFYADTTVRKFYSDTTVMKFYADSAVRKFYADTTVRKFYAYTTVRKFYTTMSKFYEDTTVSKFCEDTTVSKFYEDTTVNSHSSVSLNDAPSSAGRSETSLTLPT